MMPRMENSMPHLPWQIIVKVLAHYKILYQTSSRRCASRKDPTLRHESCSPTSHYVYANIPKSKTIWGPKHFWLQAWQIKDIQLAHMCVYIHTVFCCKIIFIICWFNYYINYHFAFTKWFFLQFAAKNLLFHLKHSPGLWQVHRP